MHSPVKMSETAICQIIFRMYIPNRMVCNAINIYSNRFIFDFFRLKFLYTIMSCPNNIQFTNLSKKVIIKFRNIGRWDKNNYTIFYH